MQNTLQLAMWVSNKLRRYIDVTANVSREDIEAAVHANENVLRFAEDLNIRKVIVVPGKPVNIIAN